MPVAAVVPVLFALPFDILQHDEHRLARQREEEAGMPNMLVEVHIVGVVLVAHGNPGHQPEVMLCHLLDHAAEELVLLERKGAVHDLSSP